MVDPLRQCPIRLADVAGEVLKVTNAGDEFPQTSFANVVRIDRNSEEAKLVVAELVTVRFDIRDDLLRVRSGGRTQEAQHDIPPGRGAEPQKRRSPNGRNRGRAIGN